MINVKISDGVGRGNFARVTSEGTIPVVVHPHPPRYDQTLSIPFRQYFTDNGMATGSNDMLVDGSSTNVEFYVAAQEDYDVYLKSISVVIADAGAELDEFGNLPALSNGVEFSWFTQDQGKIIINEGIKTNFEFIRQSGDGMPTIGQQTNSFRANNVAGSSEAYIPFLDFEKIFGMPWGFQLKRGTRDRLSFTIRDNVSTMDTFNIIAYGLKRNGGLE